MKIEQISENTLMISYSNRINPDLSDRLLATLSILQQQLGHYLLDAVPSYCSMLLTIDVLKISMTECQAQIENLLVEKQLIEKRLVEKRVIKKAVSEKRQQQGDIPALAPSENLLEIPVYYGEEVALDAREVCVQTGLDWQQIIELHTQESYRVYAIGFAPGFAYLGHLPDALSLERKATPRARVPKGSVAIAGRQTAVYPKSSPGGWHIIGRTPISIVDFERENLSLFQIGARVRFQAISRQDYLDLGGHLEPVLL